jgi:hypothetical protein
LWQPPLLGNRQ